MRLKSAASLFVVSAALTGAVAMAPTASAIPSTPSAVSAQSAASGPSVSSKVAVNQVTVWANDVNIRAKAKTDAKVVGQVDQGTYPANCQRQGDTVEAGGYKNDWWVWLANRGGYISAVFVTAGNDMEPVPGIPKC